MNQKETWYKSWFDTEYYHLLYQYRDDHEARGFMSNLLRYLEPLPKSKVLDLACGRGRHAIFMSERDLDVTGIDLSENNIHFAKRHEQDNLRFIQGDMSEDLGTERFDYIFNLFTSFGYFDTPEQSERAMHNIAKALKPGGRLVIDFMNVEKVRLGLVKEEEMLEGCVKFRVRRLIRDGFILKDIRVFDGDEQDRFEERVQMLDLKSFETMMSQAGLKLRESFGDFNLTPFSAKESERLIMIAERP
jgi:SAM-dependent methyltransferase